MWVKINKKRLKQVLGNIKSDHVLLQTGDMDGQAVVGLMPDGRGDAFAIRGQGVVFSEDEATERARQAGIILPDFVNAQGVN